MSKANAVILAGGKGSRLMPITERIPKPLAPIAGISAFERIVNLLRHNGLADIAVTTHYLGDKLKAITPKGVNIEYFNETEPLGTAGSVKSIADRLDDIFVVISGDAVCNFNIKDAVKAHRERHADATLILYRTSDPTEYGTVCEHGGEITSFCEKPSWKRTVTDLINTGIYVLSKSVLDMIPDGEYDFGKQLFPAMLEAHMRVYGYECDGYWYDIGDMQTYYDCNFAFEPKSKNVISAGVEIDKTSSVDGCVIHKNVIIGANSMVKDSIICEGVKIGNGCRIYEGCVIGAYTIIDDNASLTPGMTLGSGLYVGKGARIMRKIVFGEVRRRLFDDDGISGVYGSAIDSEFCGKLGQSLCAWSKRIGVMHDNSPQSAVLSASVMCGVQYAGGEAFDLHNGFPALAAYSIKAHELDCAVYIAYKDKRVVIKLYDKNALSPSREAERTVENAFVGKTPPSAAPQAVTRTENGELYEKYVEYLNLMCDLHVKADISVATDNFVSELLISLYERTGTASQMSVTEDSIEATDENGEKLSYWHIICIILKYCKLDKKLALPGIAPQAVEDYARALGYECVFYNDSESSERTAAREDIWARDTTALGLMLCAAACRSEKSLGTLKNELPCFYAEAQSVEYDDDKKARCISRISRENGENTSRSEGVRIAGSNGSVVIVPRYEGGFRLFAEAVSYEAAQEMFAEAKKRIKNADDAQNKKNQV